MRKASAMADHAKQFAGELGAQSADVLLAASCRWLFVPTVGRHVRIPSVVYLQEPCRSLYEAQPTPPWIAEEPVVPWWGPRAMRHWLASATRLHPLRLQLREELRSIAAFDRVLVNSHFSRESVRRAYGIDARVCYLGIDTDRFVEHPGERCPVLVSVGEFALHKNPEFVIRAVGLSRNKPVLRWIANRSDEPCVEAMTRLSRELGVVLDLRVRVTDEELVRHYQEGMAMLYAPHLEPFGLAALEASACGMPVIGLAEGGVRETVVDGESGRLVETPEQMASAIDQIMANPSTGRALGRRGAAMVRRRWTMAQATARLEGHLHEVAAQAATRATRQVS